MVLANSPLACMRCARADFDLSSALGSADVLPPCPVCCCAPLPAQLKLQLCEAGEDSGHHAHDVFESMASRSERYTMSRSRSSRIVAITSGGVAAQSIYADAYSRVTRRGVVEHRGQARSLLASRGPRQLVGVDPFGSTPGAVRALRQH
jgi:hypothetical protein